MEAGGAAHDLIPETATSSQGTPATPGELLKAARIGRHVSIQQIADDLHLDVRVVEAIESNNFALLGPPVYSRGHLRKYATLVGLSPEVIIAHYELLADIPIAPAPIPASVTVPSPARPSPRASMRMIAGIVVAIALLAVAGWLVKRLDSNSGPVSGSQTIDVMPEADAEPGSVVQLPGALGTNQATPPEPVPSVPPAAADSPLANAGNDVTMQLRFTEPSWVEVYDATNRRLMYGIGQAGDARTLTGKPPLRVTLGLAAAVSLDVNNRAVPVPRLAGKDAAHFTVAADGSVR